MHKGTAFILVSVAVAGGYVIGRYFHKTDEGSGSLPTAKVVAPGTPPEPGSPERKRIPSQGTPPPADTTVYKVEVGESPVKGGKQAKVTIVEFSEFQCPFCSRVGPTLKQIADTYKDDVRFVFKHMPLEFHPNAMPAAMATFAAHEQGKFWEMHDLLFANQQSLDRETFDKHAAALHLDMGKFKAAIDGAHGKSAVEADKQLAGTVGASGTPTFFINGRKFRGAQPFDNFKTVIDEEIKKADAKVAAGVSRANLYAEIIKDGVDQAAAPPAPAPSAGEPPGPEADQKVWSVDPGDSPSKGPKNAAITMVVFSDFQCPYCSRIEPTISQIEKDYPGKVRVVWKNYPLPFHNNAKPAALAALAAGQQGKFWEMHDKLFENQQSLDQASLERHAQSLGLNMAKFKTAMAAPSASAMIDADMKQAAAVEVNGTPATFVNGRKIGGAYPYDTFKKVVEQEMAKTRKKS